MVLRVTCVALQAALAAEIAVARDDRCGERRKSYGGNSSRWKGGGEEVGDGRGLGERGAGGSSRSRRRRRVVGIVGCVCFCNSLVG